MSIEIRSPLNEKSAIILPEAVSNLQKTYSGTICSDQGDEYKIINNIVYLPGDVKARSFAQSTNHWTLTAKLYEELWRKRSLSILTGEPFPVEKESELLVEWTNPVAGGKYLDAGCSTALYARALKQACPECEVAALDFSKAMLEEARLKAEADQTDLYLLQADAREMPFFSKSFDGVAMGGTLNELSDALKVLFECRRVLKNDGVMFMMHLVKADTWTGRMMQESAGFGGINFWSVQESNEMFKRAGFKVQDQFRRGIVCFSRLKPV